MDNEQLLGKLLIADLTGFKPSSQEIIGALIRLVDSQNRKVSELQGELSSFRRVVRVAFKQMGHPISEPIEESDTRYVISCYDDGCTAKEIKRR